MAGDWIKVEKSTARKPEVLALSELLGIHPDHAFGLCVRFWFWCDDQLKTCHAQSVTNVTLDYVVGHTGFATALVKVGWLLVRDGSLEVPNFDRHLSASAKKRAESLRRKRKQRHESVTEMSRTKRDKRVTRDRDREESNKKKKNTQESRFPASLDTAEFRATWDRWTRHRIEKQKPLGAIEADAQMMDLSRFDSTEAVAIVEFSIRAGALNLISNGDHRGKAERSVARTGNGKGKALSVEDLTI